MNRRNYIKTIVLGAFTPCLSASTYKLDLFTSNIKNNKVDFKSNWSNWHDMKWIGPEYWGNRLQDWRLKNGMAVCGVTAPNRTLQLLTVQKDNDLSAFKVSVSVSLINTNFNISDKGCVGLRLGNKGIFEDYRSAAVFGKGFDIGFTPQGNFKIGKDIIATGISEIPKTFKLEASFQPVDKDFELQIKIQDLSNNESVFEKSNIQVKANDVVGNFALLSDFKKDGNKESIPSVGFSDWRITSNRLYSNEDQIFGPICFAQYTLHNNKLKLTAQLAPVEDIKGHKIVLQFKDGEHWKTQENRTITHLGRAINFEVPTWKHKEDVEYRVLAIIPLKNETHQYIYNGTIASEPIDKDEVSAAVFSCNFHYGFPDNDVRKNVTKLNPDIILFLGDQFYEGTGGFGVQFKGSIDNQSLDYLRKWMMFGWSYRELFKNKPCAIIPDDHDVYHGNVWGENGKKANTSKGYGAPAQDSGGYKMPAEWVNMVQFTQTSHLPDPFDSSTVKQQIGVYYTQWNYAGVSFAILEDRKFKSAPKYVLPDEAKVWNGWIQNKNFDIKQYRDLEANLLGDRQHKFLDSWTKDWSNNTAMKVVLSQTNFAAVATLPKGAMSGAVIPSLPIPEKGEYVLGDAPTVDMDSNGWPANKRDEAVKAIRKCFAFHIAGDQHLGSFVQYGVDKHGDSGYAFAGPALNNIWPRRFWPHKDIAEHTYENPAYVGNHNDGFGNKVSIHAVANPFNTGIEPAIIHNRATGYGLVTFNKKNRTIKTSCWPRYANIDNGDEEQFPGWPITVTQEENYGRKAVAWLPTIKVNNGSKPVVFIYDENEELQYCIKMAAATFLPKTFSKGRFTIEIKDFETQKSKVYKRIKAKIKNKKVINVDFT